jgi:hypothetical protein
LQVALSFRRSPAAGQGNHLSWNAEIDGVPAFLRIENGPEGDDHLAMESAVLGEVAKVGVSVPQVLACDASRVRVPFAWQALERISHPDLNQWWKGGTLDKPKIAYGIGRNIARWQAFEPHGFGPFDLDAWREGRGFVAFHSDYQTYFRLRLEDHLGFLVKRSFLSVERADEICSLIDLEHGCVFEPTLCEQLRALRGSATKGIIRVAAPEPRPDRPRPRLGGGWDHGATGRKRGDGGFGRPVRLSCPDGTARLFADGAGNGLRA